MDESSRECEGRLEEQKILRPHHCLISLPVPYAFSLAVEKDQRGRSKNSRQNFQKTRLNFLNQSLLPIASYSKATITAVRLVGIEMEDCVLRH